MDSIKKCSAESHKENKATYFCEDCNVYMCNKCYNFHNELLKNHHYVHDLNEENYTENILSTKCQEENHKLELKFFCKSHNKLCCAACISKIKGEGYGQHTDCNVCLLNEIKNEKKNNLLENLKLLENFSKNIENNIKDLKNIFEKINEDKEALKIKVSKFFTNIRNNVNEREDEILLDIDNQFNNLYCSKDIIKKSEKIPKEIKISLEKGKLINDEWDKKNLSLLINACVKIENNLETIKTIHENIEKCKSKKINISFIPEEEKEMNIIIDNIKNFGKILNEGEEIWKFKKIVKNSIDEYKNKNIKMELIYSAKRDGQNCSDCHKKCNKVPNTFSIVTTNKGIKFGFFRSSAINGDGPYLIDNKAFFISFEKEKIYKILNNLKIVAFDNSCFIQIASCFYISGNVLTDKFECPNLNDIKKKFDGFTEDYELTDGEKYYYIKNFEVYKIDS